MFSANMGLRASFTLIVLAATLALTLTSKFEESSTAKVSVVQERNVVDGHQSGILPSEVQITAFGKQYNLKLVQNSPIFASGLTVDIMNLDDKGNTVITPANSTHNHQELNKHFFTDETGQSSLHVEMKDGNLYLEGILRDGIRIEPGAPEQSGEPIHIAYKQESRNGTFHGCHAIMPNYTAPIELQNTTMETRSLHSTAYVEVLVVVDYKITSHFNFNLDFIKSYLGVFYNGVNRRYATFSSPYIRIVITGIITTTGEASEVFVERVYPKIADADLTLDKFGKWVYANKDRIKTKYDVVFWLNGMDLGGWRGEVYQSTTLGVAYLGGACTAVQQQNINVALGRDTPGTYSGVHTAAHEIGHLLGATHDGDKGDNPPGNPGSEKCPWKDGYIMSYEYGTRNHFYFSSCSIKEFQFTIQSSQASCLWDNPIKGPVILSSYLPGQLVSLDVQCKHSHGDEYFIYNAMNPAVCVERWCAKKTQIGYSFSSSGPSLEGSPCGINKVCINGDCVSRKK